MHSGPVLRERQLSEAKSVQMDARRKLQDLIEGLSNAARELDPDVGVEGREGGGESGRQAKNAKTSLLSTLLSSIWPDS